MKALVLNSNNHYEKITSYNKAEWLIVEDPTEEEIVFLQETYNMPRDFIIDSLDDYEVSRHEIKYINGKEEIQLLLIVYPDITESFDNYNEYQTLSLSLIIYKDKLITVGKKIPTFVEEIYTNQTGTFNDIHHEQSENHGSPVLEILWQITKAYVEAITDLNHAIEEFEQEVTRSHEPSAFNKLISIHKSLVFFRTAINRNHDIIQHVIETEIFIDSDKESAFLHDIKVLSNQAHVMVNQSNEMITHLSEVFSSVMSYNLSNVMKFLTSISIVLTIPTLIGSLWGMNVALPLERNSFAFILILIIIGIFVMLTIRWLKKKGYL